MLSAYANLAETYRAAVFTFRMLPSGPRNVLYLPLRFWGLQVILQDKDRNQFTPVEVPWHSQHRLLPQ